MIRRLWRRWTRCAKRRHEWQPAGVVRWESWDRGTVMREECENCPAVMDTEVNA